jgi:CHASE1-domain containing sensor protein
VTTATPPLRAGPEGAGQVTVLLLAPVYQESLPPKTVEERRASLKGFATGILRVGSVVKSALQGLDRDGTNVRLVDESAPGSETLLHDDLPAPAVRSDASLQAGFSAAFDVAGRHWRFSVLPTPEYLAGRRSLQAWSVLTGGLFFVGLLGTLLLSISGREARTEAKYRDLYVDAPDMYCSLRAADWSVIDCNETMVARIGFARDEIIGRPVLDFYDPDSLEVARAALQSL